MTFLVAGATGMLGQALMRVSALRHVTAIGLARRGAEVSCDITDPAAVLRILDEVQPRVIINAAAETDLGRCESDPARAYMVNARPVSLFAHWCQRNGCRLVQISTDHFFTSDGARPHHEAMPVTLVNEYARTKFAGESFASLSEQALIIRTNITGMRHWPGQPTFFEWLVSAICRGDSLNLFDDYYTSTMDTQSCALAIFDLIGHGASGLINVASREVSNKWSFAHALAQVLGRDLPGVRRGSVASLTPRRAESCGLDVSLAESILEYSLPTLEKVCRSLVQSLEQGASLTGRDVHGL